MSLDFLTDYLENCLSELKSMDHYYTILDSNKQI